MTRSGPWKITCLRNKVHQSMTSAKIQSQDLQISHINQSIFINKIDIYIQSVKY